MNITRRRPSKEGTLGELAAALSAGQVHTLVILGGNPAYNAPADLNWPQAQAKAKTVIRLGYYEDETAWNPDSHADTQWDLPMAHYLESWGDARTADGTIVPIQPLDRPALWRDHGIGSAGGAGRDDSQQPLRNRSRDLPRPSAAGVTTIGGNSCTTAFWPTAPRRQPVRLTTGAPLARALEELKAPASTPSKERLDLVFYRDSKVDDGRHNNNGWLQELPDPITKLTWDNAVLVSPATAKALGVYTERNGQNQKFFDYTVEVTLNGRTVRGPVWIQPGMADDTVGLALGYGREKTGRVGRGTGFNAYKLRTSDSLYYASGATSRTRTTRATSWPRPKAIGAWRAVPSSAKPTSNSTARIRRSRNR